MCPVKAIFVQIWVDCGGKYLSKHRLGNSWWRKDLVTWLQTITAGQRRQNSVHTSDCTDADRQNYLRLQQLNRVTSLLNFNGCHMPQKVALSISNSRLKLFLVAPSGLEGRYSLYSMWRPLPSDPDLMYPGFQTRRGTSLVLYIPFNICSPLMHSKLHRLCPSLCLHPTDWLKSVLSHSAWNLSRCLCVCVCQREWRVSGCGEVIIVVSQAPLLTPPSLGSLD